MKRTAMMTMSKKMRITNVSSWITQFETFPELSSQEKNEMYEIKYRKVYKDRGLSGLKDCEELLTERYEAIAKVMKHPEGFSDDVNETVFQLFLDFPLEMDVLHRFIADIDAKGYLSKPKNKAVKPAEKRGRKPIPEKDDIEAFVIEKLQFSDSKRFIHQDGQHKGKPNKRQLALAYMESHPEIEESTSLQTVKRHVEKAYDKINFDVT